MYFYIPLLNNAFISAEQAIGILHSLLAIFFFNQDKI